MEIAHLRKRAVELPNEERRLVEGYRKGLYPDFMMREEMGRLQEESSAARKRTEEVERQIKRLDTVVACREQVIELTERLSQGLDKLDSAQRRELLRLLVDRITYDDGSVAIKTILAFDQGQLHPLTRGLG